MKTIVSISLDKMLFEKYNELLKKSGLARSHHLEKLIKDIAIPQLERYLKSL